MHSSEIPVGFRHPHEAQPGIRVLCDQQSLRDDIAAIRDPLQQSAPPKLIVILAEPVFLDNNGERL